MSMRVSPSVMPRHEAPSASVTTKLPDSPAGLDDEQLERWAWEDAEPAPSLLPVSFDEDQPQPSICDGLEPSPSSPVGDSYKADYVVMAAVCAIIVFLWMQ